MRDPNRIHKFCDRLATAWMTVSDLSFGQLMTAILSSYINEKISSPFYLEDDEMIAYIEGYLYGNKRKDSE